MPLSWTEIEPRRGVYDFSKVNRVVQRLGKYKEVHLWAQFRILFLDSQYPDAPDSADSGPRGKFRHASEGGIEFVIEAHCTTSSKRSHRDPEKAPNLENKKNLANNHVIR